MLKQKITNLINRNKTEPELIEEIRVGDDARLAINVLQSVLNEHRDRLSKARIACDLTDMDMLFTLTAGEQILNRIEKSILDRIKLGERAADELELLRTRSGRRVVI